MTEREVEFEIKQMNENGKSTGCNEIPPKLVKKSRHIVKPCIPNDLLEALVTPVFKANSLEEFSNFSSISVLPCFSKILENITYKRIIKYLDESNIFRLSRQYGFRKTHSTNLVTY